MLALEAFKKFIKYFDSPGESNSREIRIIEYKPAPSRNINVIEQVI